MRVGETLASNIWPNDVHAVVAVADPTKGERLVLVTSCLSPDMQTILQAAHATTVPAIAVPRNILTVPRLPRLGSGKVDYPSVQRLAEAAVTAPSHSPAATRVAPS